MVTETGDLSLGCVLREQTGPHEMILRMWKRTGAAFERLVGDSANAVYGIPVDGEYQCKYDQPAEGCLIMFPPNQGYREDGMCFCSVERAVTDKEHSIM
ncbi:hypothetical protein [Rhodococcus sp. 24CO]|uniref:hypothetical protein n=1 Tax=Rhodococcus sp. 24CO TaxID=3117460 RepID=UPI003D345841